MTVDGPSLGGTAAKSLRLISMPLDFTTMRSDVLAPFAGTLSNTDPMHFRVFREMFQEIGFNNGEPIDEVFFRTTIAGRHNPDIMAECFPSWTEAECERFSDEKEANFRTLAGVMDLTSSSALVKSPLNTMDHKTWHFPLL